MATSPKISIICPAYNAERTISRTIESVTSQDYNDWQLIIVDDGSSDNTSNIAKSYSDRNPKITVVSQTNEGQASARNSGLKLAEGEWILFIDSDDKYEGGAFSRMVETVERHPETDVVQFGFNIFRNGKLLRTPHTENILFSSTDIDSFIKIRNLYISTCNKLYSRKYITSYFDRSAVYGEDIRFNYQNMKLGMSVVAIPDCLYDVYLDTVNSVNKRYKPGRLCDSVINSNIELSKTNEIFKSDQLRKTISNESIDIITSGIYLCVDKLPRKECYKEFDSAYKKLDISLFSPLHNIDQRLDKKIVWSLFIRNSKFPLYYVVKGRNLSKKLLACLKRRG